MNTGGYIALQGVPRAENVESLLLTATCIISSPHSIRSWAPLTSLRMGDSHQSPGVAPSIELMEMNDELDWVPEWIPRPSPSPNQLEIQSEGQNPHLLSPSIRHYAEGSQSQISTAQSASSYSEDIGVISKAPETIIIVEPSPDRTVNRRLRGIHLFVR